MAISPYSYNLNMAVGNDNCSVVEQSSSGKEEMEESIPTNTAPLNNLSNPINSLLFKLSADYTYLKSQILLNNPIKFAILIPIIEQLISDTNMPINQKMRLIGCLIFLYENYPDALSAFCTTRRDDLVSNPSGILVFFLKSEMEIIDRANSSHSESDLRSIPAGKNHKLTDFFGDLILNSNGTINLGGVLLALDLVQYFFKDEQREQIKIVLNELINNEAFQNAVDATIAVHQSVENEIRISLKVPLNQPVNPRMAKKAVFKAIFSVLRQRENIGNCYAIAMINLLTHNKSKIVYELYVKFITKGTVSAGSFDSPVSMETLMSSQPPHFSNFDKQIDTSEILNFHSVQIVLSVLGYNYQTIPIQDLNLGVKTSVLEFFKRLAFVDSLLRNNRGENVNPEVFYHRAVDLLFSFKEDRLQWVLSCIFDFAILNSKDKTLKFAFMYFLDRPLKSLLVNPFTDPNQQKKVADVYKYFINKLGHSIWANIFSHSKISYSNQTLTVHSSPIDPPLKVIHAVEEESQKLIAFLKRQQFFIYKDEQSTTKLLKSSDYEQMLKRIFVVITDDLKKYYISRGEERNILIIEKIVQFWNNQISSGFDVLFYEVIAKLNENRGFKATASEHKEFESKLGFCPLLIKGSGISKLAKAIGLSVQSESHIVSGARHFLENLRKSVLDYKQKTPFSSNRLVYVEAYNLDGGPGHSFVIRPSAFDFLLKDGVNLEKFINEKMISSTLTLLHQKVESTKLSIIFFEAFQGVLSDDTIKQFHAKCKNCTVSQIQELVRNRFPNLSEKLLNSFDINLPKISRKDIISSFDQFFIKLVEVFNVNPAIKALLLEEINEGLVLYSHIELAAVISDILIQTNSVLISTKNLEFFILNFFSLPAVINIADLNYSHSVEDPLCEHLSIKASFRDAKLHFYIHNGYVEKFQSSEDEKRYGHVVFSYLA